LTDVRTRRVRDGRLGHPAAEVRRWGR
jgi:hypothetical protein